jgi:hypothetical protein
VRGIRRRKERFKEASHELEKEKARMASGQFGKLAPLTQAAPKSSGHAQAKNTLTTVINSLDKLVRRPCHFLVYAPAARVTNIYH